MFLQKNRFEKFFSKVVDQATSVENRFTVSNRTLS